jgi:hypothetical protein
MTTEPIFIPATAWERLRTWLNSEGAEIAQALDLRPSPITGEIDDAEMIDRLGDGLGVWPERLRDAYEAGVDTITITI